MRPLSNPSRSPQNEVAHAPSAAGRRYLVVGATGHVGSQVALALARAGLDVTALVRRAGQAIHGEDASRIRLVQGDSSRLDSLRLFHLQPFTSLDAYAGANYIPRARRSSGRSSIREIGTRAACNNSA